MFHERTDKTTHLTLFQLMMLTTSLQVGKKVTKSFVLLLAADLKKNGLFTTSSQTPVTPGPPKKKQKFSHDRNSHHHNHTPHHTPNNHKRSHIFFSDNDFKNKTPKSNKFNKFKHYDSTGSAKPWKPKRPVPISRDSLPPTKLILDEADDFPRGGGKREKEEEKKKKKRKMMKKTTGVTPEGHRGSGPQRLCWTVSGATQGSGSKQENGEKKAKKKRNRDRRNSDKKNSAPMYPTDENLFIIKQRRKRSR